MELILAQVLVACSAWNPQVSPAAPAPAQPAAPPQAQPESAKKKLPNLVLITIDTCRADHLGCYGYARRTSPTIDALANESVVFERCYSAFPQTTPSHCSIFTGLYPYEHGVSSCSFRATEEEQAALALSSTDQMKPIAEILA